MDDERLDAAIDDAARRMTAGEPRADFRARVLARIGTGSRLKDQGSRFAMWRPALAGLSVAALIVIVVMVSRDRERPELGARGSTPVAQGSVTEKPVARTAPQKAVVAQVRLKPDATYRSEPGATSTSRTVRRSPETTDSSNSAFDIEPLTGPAIDTESIAVAGLPADASIQIEPLQPAAPIAVAPIGVENQGDRQ